MIYAKSFPTIYISDCRASNNMRGYFESDSYNTNEDDKSHDLRTLTIGVDIGGLIVDMSDYSIMNEFGSQRNEQSMRTRVSKEKAIELRDALLKIYPIE